MFFTFGDVATKFSTKSVFLSFCFENVQRKTICLLFLTYKTVQEYFMLFLNLIVP